MSVNAISLWQVCVLLPLYLWLHQTTSVLSSHQLSIQTGAPDQTLSTGFLIQIHCFIYHGNPVLWSMWHPGPTNYIYRTVIQKTHKIALWLTFSSWGIKGKYIYLHVWEWNFNYHNVPMCKTFLDMWKELKLILILIW